MLKELLNQLPDTYTQLVLDIAAKRARREEARARESAGDAASGACDAASRPDRSTPRPPGIA